MSPSDSSCFSFRPRPGRSSSGTSGRRSATLGTDDRFAVISWRNVHAFGTSTGWNSIRRNPQVTFYNPHPIFSGTGLAFLRHLFFTYLLHCLCKKKLGPADLSFFRWFVSESSSSHGHKHSRWPDRHSFPLKNYRRSGWATGTHSLIQLLWGPCSSRKRLDFIVFNSNVNKAGHKLTALQICLRRLGRIMQS